MSGGLRIPKWAEPRVVKCLKGTKIVSISLGKTHCAAVSKSGQLFIWGDHAMEIQKVSEKSIRYLVFVIDLCLLSTHKSRINRKITPSSR